MGLRNLKKLTTKYHTNYLNITSIQYAPISHAKILEKVARVISR